VLEASIREKKRKVDLIDKGISLQVLASLGFNSIWERKLSLGHKKRLGNSVSARTFIASRSKN